MRKQVVSLVAVAAFVAVGFAGGASGHPPSATASKACSAYAEEHFGDVTAQTPGGIKCLGPGEFCSHAPGYAKAYRRAGFVCNRKGRLVRI